MNFNGAGIKDWVLAIAGNLFIVILVVRMIGHYARNEMGAMLTSGAAAIVLVGFIYFPDQVIGLLKHVWQLG